MKVERQFRFQPGFLFLAPVLDTALILACFVLFNSSFLLQPGVAVEVPKSAFSLVPSGTPRVLSITGPPRPALYWENEEITEGKLREHLEEMAREGGTLVIKAERLVPYDLVYHLSNLALERGVAVVLAGDGGR
jgi:biopolymer transport protein ExbD